MKTTKTIAKTVLCKDTFKRIFHCPFSQVQCIIEEITLVCKNKVNQFLFQFQVMKTLSPGSQPTTSHIQMKGTVVISQREEGIGPGSSNGVPV
jgi:hypothetical protein